MLRSRALDVFGEVDRAAIGGMMVFRVAGENERPLNLQGRWFGLVRFRCRPRYPARRTPSPVSGLLLSGSSRRGARLVKSFYLTRRGERTAEIRPVEAPKHARKARFAKGTFTYIAPDFDAPLDDFTGSR